MRPWEPVLADLLEGNKRMEWENREPFAYWKGNPEVADTRKDLLKCNVSEEQDWNARLYAQVIFNTGFLIYVLWSNLCETCKTFSELD